MTEPLVDRWRASRQTRGPGHWRWLGCLAGVVLAVTSWLCGAVPHEYLTVWPGVIPWRANGGSPLAATFLFLALAVMLYAWWALRDLTVTVGWQLRTAALWCAPLLLSAPLFSRDVYSYAAQGLMLQLGGDPYHHGVRHLASSWVTSVSPVWLDTSVPYGPLFMVLARLAAAGSGGQLLVAVGLLRLLAVGSVVAIAWAVPTIAKRLGADPGRAVWLALLTPIVGTHLISGAHNDALMIAGMVAAVALALDRRHVWAGLVIAATIAVKAPAAVVLPFVAILAAVDYGGARPLSRLRLVSRSAVAAAASGAAFVAISLATGLGFAWVGNLSTPGKSVQWTSLPTGLGMGVGAIGTVFGHNVEFGAVSVFRSVAVVVLAVTLVVIGLRAITHAQDRRFVVLSAGQALLAVIVLSPAFHGWYLLWALPFFAATVTQRRCHTVLAAVASVLAVANLPGGFSLALDTSWVGVPLCFVTVSGLAVAGWRWARGLRRRPPLPGPTPDSD